MKQPFLCISTAALADTLANDRPILAFLASKGCKLFTREDAAKLAQLLQERTMAHAVIPESIQVVAATESNKKVLETVKGIPKGYIDHLNSALRQARTTVLKHNPQAVKAVAEGTEAYANLVTLFRNVEAAFTEIGPSRLGTTLISFTENYLAHALPLIRSGKAAKFNITLLISDAVRGGTVVSLREQLDLRSNPDSDLLKVMVAEFLRLTKRNIDPVSDNKDHLSKFMRAQTMVRELGGAEPRRYLEENALHWVRAQCFYYHEHYQDERNTSLELGYLCGAEAPTRFQDYLANIKKVEVEPVTRKGSKLHQIARRF